MMKVYGPGLLSKYMGLGYCQSLWAWAIVKVYGPGLNEAHMVVLEGSPNNLEVKAASGSGGGVCLCSCTVELGASYDKTEEAVRHRERLTVPSP
ncbi:hypothetical protein SDJN02_00692, partial [Cucurbita argyrosperma subsp. argyrosperma]